MRKGARVRVKSAPKVHSLACPICGKRVVGLSRKQTEEDLRNGRGIRIYETLLTLLDTWKRRGLNPQEELSKALMRAWAKLRKL
jgi:hypothetical protein